MNKLKIIDVANDLKKAYEVICAPLCEELSLPQVAFDIIMFLSNNPDKFTAKDICKYKSIKPNLISLYVDKLVENGYLKREMVEGDRRKIRLICTNKCDNIVKRGQMVQKQYLSIISDGITKEEQEILYLCFEKLEKNALAISKK